MDCWYTWASLIDFNTWHDKVCTALGIPHPGRNAATGEIDPEAQWTTAYTEAVVVADDDVRAIVEQHVAETVPNGLGNICEQPPTTIRDDETWQ